MRNRLMIVTAALLLLPALSAAQAPQPQTPQAPPAPQTPPAPQVPPVQAPTPGISAGSTIPFTGTLDFGGLFTTTTGDEARYERFRDARDGVYSTIELNQQTNVYFFDANAGHIGYRDQRYDLQYMRHKLNFGFDFVGQPLNFSEITRTPYTTDGTTLTLDGNARRQVQGPTFAPNDGLAVGVPCAPGAPPASCSNPAQAAQAIANRSIYNGLAPVFDLRYQRNTAAVGAVYNATRDFDVDLAFASIGRSGIQPWGASFAFNTAVEIPKPLEERTNDVAAGVSWRKPQGMFRIGYAGSWFNNRLHSLTWDNPDFFNSFNNGLTPPNGPYDPNGYSNGNGPAQGRFALAPDNNQQVVSATGLYKFWKRTAVNGNVQYTAQHQDDDLIPFTINPVINSPVVFAAFPHLAQLPRATAEAKATGVNTLLNFTTAPYRHLSFTARYRFNKRDVQTPIFDATEYVRFDAVPEEIEEGFSPQFDVSRHLADVVAAYTPSNLGTVRLGYGHEQIHRAGRGFADVGENVLRASWDTYANQYVTLRAAFEAGWRRGSGFVEAASGTDDLDVPTGPGGTQPTLRYFDEADRNRTRGSLIFTVMPKDTYDVYVQFASGRDKYRPDDSVPVSRPGELFGLQRATLTSWNVGIDSNPNDRISAGASYGHDNLGSFQRSRNANPPPDPSWTDPSRDWTLDDDSGIHTVNAYFDLLRPFRNTNARFGYDLSKFDNSFVHGGPRIAALAAINQFIPLPDIESTWQRVRAEFDYYVTQRAGIGVGYYFEKLSIGDFAAIDTFGPVGFNPATGDPRIDWLGVLSMGYGSRPYTGNTGFVRFLYKF